MLCPKCGTRISDSGPRHRHTAKQLAVRKCGFLLRPCRCRSPGNADSEYEDAYWAKASHSEQEMHLRFAVADGATETSFSGIWARQLVRAYCVGAFDGLPNSECLSKLRRKWWSIVRKRSRCLGMRKRNLREARLRR